MRAVVPALSAALLAALGAWVSLGTIGFAGPDGPRLGVLPLSGGAALAAAGAFAAVLGLWRAGAPVLPVALLGFLLLPWLPFPVPSAFLIWTWPVAGIIWVAVLLLMLAGLPRRVHITASWPVAAAAALLIFSLSAWRAAPMTPGGDEPHYLVITQSLLIDGDLSIEGVHRRGDYRAYFAGDLPPHVQRRGQDGRIYSVHAPGLPALVAPAFAIGGYHGVVIWLLLVATAGSALAWYLGSAVTGGDVRAAWFGWAAVTLPVTAIFQSFTVYPDGVGGVLALTGLWALVRAGQEARTGDTNARPWLLHGAALALLPWLHTRFAVLAGGFGALILLRLSTTRNPAAKAVAFLSVPAVSAVLWVGFFVAIYGTPDPSAPYARGEVGSFAYVPGGLGGLFFDQRFGLLAYAPVLAVAFAGVGAMIARRPWRRLALELLFVTVPYLITVGHFAMWWGGWSPPARFFAPILPLFAVPAAVAWHVMERRATRLLGASALAFTALASLVVVGIDRGRLAFNTRDAQALWLEWAGRAADLASAAPLWARDVDAPLFRAAAVWMGVIALVWLGIRAIEGSGRLAGRHALRTAVVAALCGGVMLASSVVWAFERTSGANIAPSQLHLLDAVAARPRAIAMQIDGWRQIAASEIGSRLRIEMFRTPATRPVGRDAAALFAVPPLPAGTYRVSVLAAAARGWMMFGIARDQFALRTLELPLHPLELTFPLPVRGLIVRGDEDARRGVRGLVVEPVRLLRPGERLTSDMARRAVRYGASTVYFLDDRSFPEPDAFWVGGGRDSRIVLQPDAPRSSQPVRLRNGAAANHVIVESGGWREEWTASPGEERLLSIPLDLARGGAVVRFASSSGFRPSERDPESGDTRFLGVYVSVEDSR